MFLDLNEEQNLIRETAREFTEAVLAPVAAALDRGEEQDLFLEKVS
jgi:alkylation response protein AidB-like acyl-CoA dehydrogenase